MNELQAPGQSRSLADHISSTGYETVAVEYSPVSEDDPAALLDLTAQGEDSSSEDGNTAETAGQEGTTEGQTNPTVPDPNAEQIRVLDTRQAELDKREQQIRDAEDAQVVEKAQAALRREEALFNQKLSQTDDPAEKRALLAEFRLTRANRERDFERSQRVAMETSTLEQREANAKNQVILAVMAQEGIPDRFRNFLATAGSVEEFDKLVADAKDMAKEFGLTRTSSAQPTAKATPESKRQERLDSGVDTPSGNNAGFVPPAAPKERSGDLMGLIKSRGYRMIDISQEAAA